MARGILYVESRPISAERTDEYNTWYTEVHMPEVVAQEGFVSARRYGPRKPGEPYVSIYEIEADDVNAAVKNLFGAQLTMSDAMASDPPAVVRVLELQTEVTA